MRYEKAKFKQINKSENKKRQILQMYKHREKKKQKVRKVQSLSKEFSAFFSKLVVF